jgi:hypothetical protein
MGMLPGAGAVTLPAMARQSAEASTKFYNKTSVEKIIFGTSSWQRGVAWISSAPSTEPALGCVPAQSWLPSTASALRLLRECLREKTKQKVKKKTVDAP